MDMWIVKQSKTSTLLSPSLNVDCEGQAGNPIGSGLVSSKEVHFVW